MTDTSDFIPYLVVWAAALGLIVWQTWRGAGAGLMLAYCFQMLMLYWLGAAIQVLPWADLPNTPEVYLGFQQCTYAMLAFTGGALLIGPLIIKRLVQQRREQLIPDPRLPRAYVTYGIWSYFILTPTLGRIQGFNALAAVGSQLVVVGCCLMAWVAWRSGGQRALLRALGPTLLIPCVTIVVQGFLGFGVMALSTIIMFCAQFFRPRWILILGLFVSCYLGLSVYATYMKGRNDLREAIWNLDSTYSDKIDTFLGKALAFEFFDPREAEHLYFVDNRLNQDGLVGKAVGYLGTNDNFAKGDTLWQAVLGMIPRVIWPDKPTGAGSGGLVTQFTGEVFADFTSVGVGPVLELYGNFGTPAVVIGFFLLGTIIRVLDVMSGVHLLRGDWLSFGTYFLVGISFLNVSGSFVETSMGAMASLVLAKIVNVLLKRQKKTVPDLPVDQPVELARV